MFHVRGYDASGGVEVHPHEVSHQLGDGGCTNLVGAVRVHALQLHAPLKLVLFAVLGDENKACMQYWGGGGLGGRGGGCSPADENKACIQYWGEEGRVIPKGSAANQILSKTQNSCSSQSWGMKTKPVHNTGGGGGRGVDNQQQIRFSLFSFLLHL